LIGITVCRQSRNARTRLVAELVPIARRADDGHHLRHVSIMARATGERSTACGGRFSRSCCFSFLTFGIGLGRQAITEADEAYYAEAAREMVVSGDWLTPHFNYEDRWQKPVLYYWLTRPSIS
jgi:hypothetical protein